jgi:hypothetical protein
MPQMPTTRAVEARGSAREQDTERMRPLSGETLDERGAINLESERPLARALTLPILQRRATRRKEVRNVAPTASWSQRRAELRTLSYRAYLLPTLTLNVASFPTRGL